MNNNQERKIIEFIKELSNYPQIWSYIKLENNKLIINTSKGIVTYDLTKINIEKLNNENFQKNLNIISIDDFSNLIDISNKIEQVATKTETQENIPKNSKIKNFKVLEKKNENGITIEYPYFIDESNNIHILFNYAGTNILKEYQILSLQKGGIVTEEDVYNHFKRKMKKVELTEDYKLGENIREEVNTEIHDLNKSNKSERVFVNKEHGIYKSGDNLYTFNSTDKNYLKKNSYHINENEEEQNTKTHFTSDINQNDTMEEIVEQPTEQKEIRLISEAEYYMLIEYYTPLEKPEIALFESYMEDILYYLDFVSVPVREIYIRYSEYMLKLELTENLSPSLESTLNRYKQMLEKKEEKAYENTNKNEILTKVRKLEDKQKKAGFTSFYIIISCVIIMLLIITIVLVNMNRG